MYILEVFGSGGSDGNTFNFPSEKFEYMTYEEAAEAKLLMTKERGIRSDSILIVEKEKQEIFRKRFDDALDKIGN